MYDNSAVGFSLLVSGSAICVKRNFCLHFSASVLTFFSYHLHSSVQYLYFNDEEYASFVEEATAEALEMELQEDEAMMMAI